MRRRRRDILQLGGILLVAAVGLLYTFVAGNKPLLGLDLQGGVSVVLKPKGEVDEERLQQAIAIIRQRVDAIGVAEPEISRQGNSVLIQIPGVKDTNEALALVGQTAELRFRPVLAMLPPEPTTPGTTPGSTVPGTVVPGSSVPGGAVPVNPTPGSAGAPGAVTSVTPAPSAPVASEVPPTSQQQSMGPATGRLGGLAAGESAAGAQAPPSTVSEVAPSSITTVPANPAQALPGTQQLQPQQLSQLQQQQAQSQPTTPVEQDDPTKTVILPEYETDEEGRPTTVKVRYQLGPAELTGTALQDASAGLDQQGQWVVRPRFKPGADGIDLFNKAAGACYAGAATCPTKQLGMTLDGRVISAPTIQAPTFSADQIQISGSFTERTAKELATQLRYGALPVELEPQQVQLVSATLGEDALHAGLIAGLVALVLVAAYMTAFYRLLGMLAVGKLFVEGALLWTLIAYLGEAQGLALTMAGVTGIIVSIGVSLDSNVVYYEHLKEDVHNGRTIRSSIDRSFHQAFSTILKADGTSAIGALLLYWLSVGPVRGFAFYLGVSTVIDLVCSYFYMHPGVSLMARTRSCERHPGWFGLPRQADTAEGDAGDRRIPPRRGAAVSATTGTGAVT